VHALALATTFGPHQLLLTRGIVAPRTIETTSESRVAVQHDDIANMLQELVVVIASFDVRKVLVVGRLALFHEQDAELVLQERLLDANPAISGYSSFAHAVA